jgi:hypothetical protein
MLERIKNGYRVDSFEYNMALSNYFLGFNKRFSKRSELSTHSSGIKSFWEWLLKLKIFHEIESNNNFREGLLDTLVKDE